MIMTARTDLAIITGFISVSSIPKTEFSPPRNAVTPLEADHINMRDETEIAKPDFSNASRTNMLTKSPNASGSMLRKNRETSDSLNPTNDTSETDIMSKGTIDKKKKYEMLEA